MFDHNIFQDNLVGVDFCEQMVKETNPGVLAKAEKTLLAALQSARLPNDRGHHARAESVYRGVLSGSPAGEPHDARNVLPDGRAARSSFDPVSRRRWHRSHDSAFHRLSRAPDEVRRIHEESRSAARRLVRFLLRSASGLRTSRAAARSAGLLGFVQQPGRVRLHLQEYDAIGATGCLSLRALLSTGSW